jgi:hypothetical protein
MSRYSPPVLNGNPTALAGRIYAAGGDNDLRLREEIFDGCLQAALPHDR